jgi:hypothetical protein
LQILITITFARQSTRIDIDEAIGLNPSPQPKASQSPRLVVSNQAEMKQGAQSGSNASLRIQFSSSLESQAYCWQTTTTTTSEFELEPHDKHQYQIPTIALGFDTVIKQGAIDGSNGSPFTART